MTAKTALTYQEVGHLHPPLSNGCIFHSNVPTLVVLHYQIACCVFEWPLQDGLSDQRPMGNSEDISLLLVMFQDGKMANLFPDVLVAKIKAEVPTLWLVLWLSKRSVVNGWFKADVLSAISLVNLSLTMQRTRRSASNS